jgi:Tol biopolymer transport system component
VKSVGKDDLRRVATDPWPAFTPAWSPDGSTIAYVRRAPDGSDSRILAVPADGSGPERLVATVVDHQGFVGLTWWPDSKSLIARDAGPHGRPLVRIDVATGAKQILTDGPETQDSRPTVSADGRWLGFLRTTPGKVSICVQRLAGSIQTPQCLSAQPTSVDLTWLGESSAILYRQGRTLWRAEVTPDGRPANPVKLADGDFSHLSADRTGRRVAFSRNYSDANILRLDVSATPNRRAVRTFASSEEDSEPDFSPDGREILFRSRRSGSYELYIASSRDGSQLRRLTNLGGHVGSARWSPDGKWIVFDGAGFTLPGQASHPAFTNLYVVAAAGGPVRMLTDDTVERMVPNWSHDGQWIYYNEEPGSHRTTWKIPFAPGGTAVRVSDSEMFDIVESPDGKWLYYTRPRLAKGLWRRAVAGGPEQLVPGTENLAYRYWQVRGSSVVFLQGRRDSGFALLDMRTAKLRPAGPPPKQVPNGPRGMTVSPDLQTLLYTEEDLTMGDILMIEFPPLP